MASAKVAADGAAVELGRRAVRGLRHALGAGFAQPAPALAQRAHTHAARPGSLEGPTHRSLRAQRNAAPSPRGTVKMTLSFHWFLPTYGDSRHIVGGGHGLHTGTASGARPATLAYLGQIARSAEQLGFVGALTPTGAWCDDAWLATAMLAEVTERLKFLIAFRPGLLSPTLAAQMAATYQRHSRGRLLLNVVVGGEPHEQRALRRLPRQGRPLRPCRGVPPRSSRICGRGRRWTTRASTCASRARLEPHARPAAADLLRRLLAGGRAGGGASRRRLSHMGRAPGAGRAQARVDPGARRASRAARRGSGSACT